MASSSSSQNVELEAAKFLQKLIQESKDEPSKLATKLFVILQHMKSSGKEHSMPYQVISRAMETVINQHGLDMEALKSSRLPLTSGSQAGESTTPKHSDSVPAAGITINAKSAVAEPEITKSNSFPSGKALVGPSGMGPEYYQGSGSVAHRSNQSFDQESPSSMDSKSANSQSQERRDSANYGKLGNQKDNKKTDPKRKRGDQSSVIEPHGENIQKIDPSNNLPNPRKGKMNKVDAYGTAARGVEPTNFNIVQSAAHMEHLSSALLTRSKQEDQMQRVASSYDSHGLASKVHEQRSMDSYGIASTSPLEQSSNRGPAHILSNRGDDASSMLTSESVGEHDRGRLNLPTNDGRNTAVAEPSMLRNAMSRDTGKSLVSRASAVPGTPFREQQLKQLRAQCLVFLAFRNGLSPKPLHLEIALGNIFPREGTNLGVLRQEPLDHKENTQSSSEPCKVPDPAIAFGRLNIVRETERIPAGFSAAGSLSTAHLPAIEVKDPKLLQSRTGLPSDLSMPLEERKGLIGARSLEVDMQNQTAEPQVYPPTDSRYLSSSSMDAGASNGLSNLGRDQLQVVKTNLASSPIIMNQQMNVEMVNHTGFGVPGEVFGGSTASAMIRDNWKPISGSNSEHQVVAAVDSQIVIARDLHHEKSAEEDVEDESASMALPPPKYTMLEKWVMDQQRKKLLVEQNQLLKQHKAEQKIATCFDGLKKTVSSSEDISAKTKSVIELKKLQLLALQRRLRGDFLEDFFKPVVTEMDHLRSFKKHRHGRRIKQIDKYEQKMKEERHKRIRDRQKEFFSDIEVHKERLDEVFKVKRERLKGFNKYVKEFHKRKERLHREKIDRIQREKITLLKINDVEGYLRMVQDAKSDRVKQLLKETEKYLQKLGSKLKDAKAAATQFEHDGDEMETASVAENSDNLVENEDENDQAKHYKESNEKYYLMAHSIKESIAEQPATLLGGKLREYQMNGLRWLVSLYNNHLNGILADEMGLGKTVQVISLICYLMETKNDRGPFLVVVPSSVLPGWESEINFWAPAVHKIVYAGPPEERRRLFKEKIVHQKFNVLLTTYEYLMNKHDRPKLSKLQWHYIIIDEGHRIKNASCKLNADLKHYKSSHRLLLTGTPLQNNLEELWALLNFLLPNIFNSSEDFSQWFNKPFESNGDSSAEEALLSEEENLLIINRLHQVLRPFVLRRLKHKVENELPEKIERLIRCDASAYQKLLMKRVEENLGSLGNPKARSVQNSVMELRNICNHPYLSQLHAEEVDNLIPRHYLPPIIRLCGKLEVLDRLLPKLKATDHRVLFFSTMTRLLDVMEEYLNWKHYRYLRLDGHTSGGDRGALIDLFNRPNSPYFIFLLSIRAGGVGVNLQAADTVIIFDTDWNPQVDLQAQARAHRIGQKKDVLVLRFETVQTVEEQVRAAAEHKLGVANQSITAGFFDNNTSAEDRREYLESLLRECKKEEAAPVLDDDSLNDVIARSESEIDIFESVDRQRREEEMAMWAKLANGQGKDGSDQLPPLPSRLVTEDDLKMFCEAMRIFETPKAGVAPSVGVKRKSGYAGNLDTKQYGRGKRAREVRSYEEQMTEEEFEKMCQVDSPESPKPENEGVKSNVATKDNVSGTVIGSAGSAESVLPTSAPKEAPQMPQSNQATPPVKRGRGRPKRVVPATSAAAVSIQPPSGTGTVNVEPQRETASSYSSPGINMSPGATAKEGTGISTHQVAGMTPTSEPTASVAPPMVDPQSILASPPTLRQEKGRRRKTLRAEASKGGGATAEHPIAGFTSHSQPSASITSPTSGSQSANVAPPLPTQEKQRQKTQSRAEGLQEITSATLHNAVVGVTPNSQPSQPVVSASSASPVCAPALSQEEPHVLAQEKPPVQVEERSSVTPQETPSVLSSEKGQRRKIQSQAEGPRRRGRKRKSASDIGSDGMVSQDPKLNEELQKQSANSLEVQATAGSGTVSSSSMVPTLGPCPGTEDAVLRGKEEDASQGLMEANRERVCGLPAPHTSVGQDLKSSVSETSSKNKQASSSKIGHNVRYVASMMKEILSASKPKGGERLEGELRDSPSLPVHGSTSSEITVGKNSEEKTRSGKSNIEAAQNQLPGTQEIRSGGDSASGVHERKSRRATRPLAKKIVEESLDEMPAIPPGFEMLKTIPSPCKEGELSESGVADVKELPANSNANNITIDETIISKSSGVMAAELTTLGGHEDPAKVSNCAVDCSVDTKTDASETESANIVGPAGLVTGLENKPDENLIMESKMEALETALGNVEGNGVQREDHNIVVKHHVEEAVLKQDLAAENIEEKLRDIPEGDTSRKHQQGVESTGADTVEVPPSKYYSSELQASSELMLGELSNTETDLSMEKANSPPKVAELGGHKQDVNDQMDVSQSSVSSPNNLNLRQTLVAAEEKIEGTSNSVSTETSLGLDESSQVEIGCKEATPILNSSLSLTAAEEKIESSMGREIDSSLHEMGGQVDASEIKPETVNVVCEVTNQASVTGDSAVRGEPKYIEFGTDSKDKADPDSMKKDEDTIQKKMAPTHDSAVTVSTADCLKEIKPETFQPIDASEEAPRYADSDQVPSQAHYTVLPGIDLGPDQITETAPTYHAIYEHQRNEEPDDISEKAPYTTLPGFDSGSNQAKPDTSPISLAIQQPHGNAGPDQDSNEVGCTFLSGTDAGDQVKSESEPINHAIREPQENATSEQGEAYPTDLQGNDLGDQVKRETDSIQEPQGNEIPNQVAETLCHTILPEVDSRSDQVIPETAQPHHTIEGPQGNDSADQVPEKAQHNVRLEVGLGSDQLKPENTFGNHVVQEPQENAGSDEVTENTCCSILPEVDSGCEQINSDTSLPAATIQEPQVNAGPDHVPEKAHPTVLPGDDPGSDQTAPMVASISHDVNAAPDQDSQTHTSLQGIDSECYQVIQDTAPHDHEKIQGNAGPGQLPEKTQHAVPQVVDLGSDHAKPKTALTDQAIQALSEVDLASDQIQPECAAINHVVQTQRNAGPYSVIEEAHHFIVPGIDLGSEHVKSETTLTVQVTGGPHADACPDQLPKSDIREVSESVKETLVLLEDSADVGESECAVLGVSSEYEVEAETAPTGDVVQEPQENVGQFPVNEEGQDAIPPGSDLGSDTSKAVQEQSQSHGATVEGELKFSVVGANLEDEVKTDTVNIFPEKEEALVLSEDSVAAGDSKMDSLDRVKPGIGSSVSEQVERLELPQDSAVAGQSKVASSEADSTLEQSAPAANDSTTEQVESVTEVSEAVYQQSAPPECSMVGGELKFVVKVSEANDSTNGGKLKSVTKVSETLQLQPSPADDSAVSVELEIVTEVPEKVQQQTTTADDSKVAGKWELIAEVSETVQQQSAPTDDSAVAEELETVTGVPEAVQEQPAAAYDSTVAEELESVTEVSEAVQQQPPAADDSTVAENLESVTEVSEAVQKQSDAIDDHTIAGELEIVTEVSEGVQQQPAAADDSTVAGELETINEVSETVQLQSASTDDSIAAGKLESVAKVSDAAQQQQPAAAEAVQQQSAPTDDAVVAGEESVTEVSEVAQPQPGTADDPPVAGKLESITEVSERAQQQSAPVDDAIVAGELDSVTEVSEAAQQQPAAADDSPVAGKLESITEVSETVQQQSAPTDDAIVAGELESVTEVLEAAQQQPAAADDSPVAGKLKSITEVSETVQQQSAPTDDSTVAGELEPVPVVSEAVQQQPAPFARESDSVTKVSETVQQQPAPVDDSTVAEELKSISHGTDCSDVAKPDTVD